MLPKFFEKVMYKRIVEFAETNEILYLRQFGFRKNHSTSHALIHLLNKISSAIDQHETTVGIFLDLRAITNSDYKAHSAPLFSKLRILDIFQINTFQTAKFMYLYHKNLLPSLFLNLFNTSSHIHSYSTRTANNYRVPHCRTNLKQFTILYQGPKILGLCFRRFGH